MNHARWSLAAFIAAELALGWTLCAGAAEGQRPIKFTLDLTTNIVAMPFTLPALPGLPGPPGPTEAQRTLRGVATYREKASPPVYVTVPEDLALPDNRLILQVPSSPEPETEPAAEEPEEAQEAAEPFDITLKLYWHPDTAEGPITSVISFKPGELTPSTATGAPLPGFEMPPAATLPRDSATGTASRFPEQAVGKGDYTLNTGNLTMPLAGFLPPLRLLEPKSLAEVNPEEGVTLRWEPVPGAKGFIVRATGVVFEEERATAVITWVSTRHQPPERVRSDYEIATTVEDDLRDGILLPPETTGCRLPPGVFVGASMLTVVITAVGADYYDRVGDTELRGRIRSEWTGMKFAGPGPLALPPMPAPADED